MELSAAPAVPCRYRQAQPQARGVYRVINLTLLHITRYIQCRTIASGLTNNNAYTRPRDFPEQHGGHPFKFSGLQWLLPVPSTVDHTP